MAPPGQVLPPRGCRVCGAGLSLSPEELRPWLLWSRWVLQQSRGPEGGTRASSRRRMPLHRQVSVTGSVRPVPRPPRSRFRPLPRLGGAAPDSWAGVWWLRPREGSRGLHGLTREEARGCIWASREAQGLRSRGKTSACSVRCASQCRLLPPDFCGNGREQLCD